MTILMRDDQRADRPTETEDLQSRATYLQRELEKTLVRHNALILEAELLKLELNQLFNGPADGMWVIDTNYCIQRVNQAMAIQLGTRDEALLGRKCYDILNCENKGKDACPMTHLLNGNPRFEEDSRLTLPTGKSIPVIKTATPFKGIDGDLVGILVSYKDITERYKVNQELEIANRELQRLASIDGLTQVANRRQFDLQLTLEWRRMKRHGKPLSLVICDIDFFKRYNDSCGHQEGDICLKKVAQALEQSVRRPEDMVARYGGEEFAAILPDTPGSGALTVARHMQQQIQSLELVHPDSPISDQVTISLGIADCLPAKGSSPAELIAQADKALYQAKSQGRNQAFWTSKALTEICRWPKPDTEKMSPG